MSTPRIEVRAPEKRQAEHGFTLFEVTLLVAALVMLAAAVSPALLRSVHARRQQQVQHDLEALYAAMVGSDSDGTYGFIGDLGRFPWSPDELVHIGSNALFFTDEATGVGYGWNGPYVNIGNDANDFALDPWGSPYDVGVVGPGQIRSAGPDGRFDDADDVIYPPNAVSPYGSVVVSVKGYGDGVIVNDPEGCNVTLYFSDEGTVGYVYDESTPFSFTDVHRGPHAFTASCPRYDGATATESGIVTVQGQGAQQFVEVFVQLGSTLSGSAGEAAATPDTAAVESADRTQQR